MLTCAHVVDARDDDAVGKSEGGDGAPLPERVGRQKVLMFPSGRTFLAECASTVESHDGNEDAAAMLLGVEIMVASLPPQCPEHGPSTKQQVPETWPKGGKKVKKTGGASNRNSAVSTPAATTVHDAAEQAPPCAARTPLWGDAAKMWGRGRTEILGGVQVAWEGGRQGSTAQTRKTMDTSWCVLLTGSCA